MTDGAKRILVGCCGWSYPDWEGIVYPKGPAVERLKTVARYLDCVEVNSSFYHPPTANVAENWMRAVKPFPAFRFLAKAWQRFTHEREQPWTAADWTLMMDGLKPIQAAGRLDSILFQFPQSFDYQKTNLDWLQEIAEGFAGWPIAVEVRHDSWAREEMPAWFEARGFTYCNIDQPQLEHCLPPASIVTSDTGYFRLHGRNKENWFREEKEHGDRYNHLYSEHELADLLTPVRAVSERTAKTFVLLNNHKDGKAFANAFQIRSLLEPSTSFPAPVSLLQHFPELRTHCKPDGEEQLSLV